MLTGELFTRLSIRAAAVGAVLVLAACSGGAASPAADGGPGRGTFVVAGVLPLTGPYASIGLGLEQGLKAGAKATNDQGGILGREVTVAITDSAGDPQQSVSAMREILRDPKAINGVIGELTGSLNTAVLPVTTPAGAITMTVGGQPPKGDPKNRPYNFTFGATPEAQSAATVAAAVAAHPTAKKVGVLATSDSAGKQNGAEMERQAKAAGLTVLGVEAFDPTSKDYAGQLQKLRAAGAEMLLSSLKGNQIGVFSQGLENLLWNVPVMGDPGYSGSPLETLIPKSQWERTHWVAAKSTARLGGQFTASQKAFIQAMKDTGNYFGALSTSLAGGDMILAFKYAYEKAGTLDSTAALKAMEGMNADPAAQQMDWHYIVDQGPRYSADAHDTSNIDPSLFFATMTLGQPVDGTYEGTAMAKKP